MTRTAAPDERGLRMLAAPGQDLGPAGLRHNTLHGALERQASTARGRLYRARSPAVRMAVWPCHVARGRHQALDSLNLPLY